jgi:hypothetical protein
MVQSRQLSKFTPGPWETQKLDHVDGELWLQVGWKDRRGISWGPIAELRNLVTSAEEQWANARLIAAAPELLEAAKQAVKREGDWLGVLDLAIAKAEQA